MIKIGIVADNYKVDRFEKELTKAGFTDYSKCPFTDSSTTIQVRAPEDKVNEIRKLCQKVEMHFKQSN